MPTLPSSWRFDLTLICRLLPQPTQICARFASPATSRSANYADRLTTHLFAFAFTASSLRTTSLISSGTIVALRSCWSTSPCHSWGGCPRNRSSCNCRTPSCYVAIPAPHGNRTDPVASFILNRLQGASPKQKTALPAGHPLKSVACSGSLVYQISAKL